MADNTTLPGTGEAIASDDISGVQYQRIKLIHGADGTNAGDVATANPLPTLNGMALPADMVSGTASATGTGTTSVIAAGGAGTFTYVTSLVVHNSGTADTFVAIKDGTTDRLILPAPAKGGAALSLPSPLRLADNAALQFASGAATTTMYVSAVGFRRDY
jgi:hypothetical protein